MSYHDVKVKLVECSPFWERNFYSSNKLWSDLVDEKIITAEQKNAIKAEARLDAQIDRLIEIVAQSGREKLEPLCDTLRKNYHGHVANYLSVKLEIGKESERNAVDLELRPWERIALIGSHKFLMNNFYPVPAFYKELTQYDLLSQEMVDQCLTIDPFEKRLEFLLDLLQKRGPHAFDNFCSVLRKKSCYNGHCASEVDKLLREQIYEDDMMSDNFNEEPYYDEPLPPMQTNVQQFVPDDYPIEPRPERIPIELIQKQRRERPQVVEPVIKEIELDIDEPYGYGMDTVHRKTLQFSRDLLRKHLKVTDEFLTILQEKENLLVDDMIAEIKSAQSNDAKIDVLLKIMPYRGVGGFKLFCQGVGRINRDLAIRLAKDAKENVKDYPLKVSSKTYDGSDSSLEDCCVPYDILKVGENYKRGSYGILYHVEHPKYGKVTYRNYTCGMMKPQQKSMRTLITDCFHHRMMSHRNVTKIYGIITDYLHYGLLQETVANGKMLDFINVEKDVLNWQFKVRLIADTARGMNYLHNQQKPIIHGDMKSRNVLVSHDFTAKISDYGMSLWENLTRMTTRGRKHPSTLRHTPPECFELSHSLNHKSNPKSDIYAYGLFCWEIFTLKAPFDTWMVKEMLPHLTSEKRLDLEELPKDIDGDVTKVMVDAWAQKKEDRPTFAVLLVRLEDVLMKPDVARKSDECLKQLQKKQAESETASKQK